MAYNGESQNDAFSAGQFHTVNEQPHLNNGSLTLASERWDDEVGHDMLTPHSVLAPLNFSSEMSQNGTAGANWMGGMGTIGTGDGQSAENFQKNQVLRYQGGDEDALV